MDMLDLLKVAAAEHYAHLAAAPHRTLKGLDPKINPDRPPKSYKGSVSRKDREQWEEAMMKEYRGFQDEGPGCCQDAKRSKASCHIDKVGVKGGEWQAVEV
jgi:hypothetical protein